MAATAAPLPSTTSRKVVSGERVIVPAGAVSARTLGEAEAPLGVATPVLLEGSLVARFTFGRRVTRPCGGAVKANVDAFEGVVLGGRAGRGPFARGRSHARPFPEPTPRATLGAWPVGRSGAGKTGTALPRAAPGLRADGRRGRAHGVSRGAAIRRVWETAPPRARQPAHRSHTQAGHTPVGVDTTVGSTWTGFVHRHLQHRSRQGPGGGRVVGRSGTPTFHVALLCGSGPRSMSSRLTGLYPQDN